MIKITWNTGKSFSRKYSELFGKRLGKNGGNVVVNSLCSYLRRWWAKLGLQIILNPDIVGKP